MSSKFISVLGKIGLRGNPFDVCFDIDHCWFSGSKGLIQRAGKLTGFVDNDAKTSHCLRNFGKVSFGKHPEFIGAGGPSPPPEQTISFKHKPLPIIFTLQPFFQLW